MRQVRALTVGAVLAMAGLALPALKTPALATTPVVTADGDSVEIGANQFVNGSTNRFVGDDKTDVLSYAGHRAPAKMTGPEGTASAFVSEASTLETPTSPPFPLQPLNDVAVSGTATAGATSTGKGTAVPNSDSQGLFDVTFELSQPTPVFFSGSLSTANNDAADSCSEASVDLNGPDATNSRHIHAHRGTGCSVSGPRSTGFAETVTLAAGDYDLAIDYDTEVDADPGEAATRSGRATMSMNLSFMPPTAAFTTKIAGSKATFNGGSSAAGPAARPLASYKWTFGDGKSATTSSPTVSHSYQKSPANVRNYTVALQVVDTGGAVSAPVSHTVHGTATTEGVSKTTAKVKAAGKVSPGRAGKHVVVTLSRKSGGRFHVLATHRPTLSSTSHYATSFARPNPGTCRLTARYPGDSTHLASQRTRSFAC